MSRTIENRFIMGDREKEYFVELMRNLAEFSGLRILKSCIMSSRDWFRSRRKAGTTAMRNAKDIGLVSMRALQLSPVSIRYCGIWGCRSRSSLNVFGSNGPREIARSQSSRDSNIFYDVF